MATINEVSELAKVSISTVSRVINNTVPVRESTRQRVYEAMRELGYTPNMFAQGLVTNRSKSVTLVLTDLSGAYFGPLIKSLENGLREAHYQLIISVENEGLLKVREAFDSLIHRRSDAVILFPHCLTDDEVIGLIEGAPPLIILNRYIPELAHQSIMVDNELGGRLAVEYLIGKGHRQVACITGPLSNKESIDRLAGYRLTLNKQGIEYRDELVVEGDFTVDGGVRAMQKLLARGCQFTSVFSLNDQMAAGAMKALTLSGKKIPEDVSIVGFDDVEYAELLSPGLTTIKQPVEEMGKVAAGLAVKLIHGDTGLPKQPLFDPVLIRRDSVKDLNY